MGKCDAVLAQQVFSSSSSSTTQMAMLDMIDDLEWERLKTSMGGSVIVDGVPLGGSFQHMREQLRQHKRRVEYDYSSSASAAILNRTLSREQIKAWSECIAENSKEAKGLTLAFEPRANDKDTNSAQLNVAWTPQPGLGKIELHLILEGGTFQNPRDADFSWPGASSAVISIKREKQARLLKVNARVKYPNGTLEGRGVSYAWELPRLVQREFQITDRQPDTYTFVFTCTKEADNKIWIMIAEPSGGILDGHNVDFYVSEQRRQVQVPHYPAGTYIYGRVILETAADDRGYIYFEGGLHTTDGTDKVIPLTLIAKTGVTAPD